MAVITHTIHVCPACGSVGSPNMACVHGVASQGGAKAHWRESVEVVPSTTYRGAVEALREVRGMLTDGDGDAIMGCRQAVARIDRALRHTGGQ